MSNKYLIDIGMNDSLQDVIRKSNRNFRMISSDQTRQGRSELRTEIGNVDDALAAEAEARSQADFRIDEAIDDIRDQIPHIVEAQVNTAIAAIGKVPTGGTAGQILAKASGTDFDTEWITNSGGSGNYLPITGGTLTGQLEIPDSTVADASQAPSANQYGSALHVTDQQGEQVGYLGLVHETNDNLWTQLGVTRDVNGSPAYNSLWLGLQNDGTPTVYVGDAQQAWRDALGIGTVYEANKSSINTTANQDDYVQGAKITLPAGKYVIYTQWTFGSTSSATGSTTVGVGYSSGVWTDSRDRIRQADAWFTQHSTTYICTLAAQSDIYSYGSSSVARSGCSSFIRAIKVA